MVIGFNDFRAEPRVDQLLSRAWIDSFNEIIQLSGTIAVAIVGQPIDIEIHFQHATFLPRPVFPEDSTAAMLVCHCQRVTDQAIARCVREGAGSVAEVERACGAGGCCGGCRPLVREIVQREMVTAGPDEGGERPGRGGRIFR